MSLRHERKHPSLPPEPDREGSIIVPRTQRLPLSQRLRRAWARLVHDLLDNTDATLDLVLDVTMIGLLAGLLMLAIAAWAAIIITALGFVLP